jgi:ABC-type multidrug transport system fused ATPase/permease subunit
MKELRLIRFFLSGNYSRLAVSWVMGLAGVGLAVVLPQQVARLTNLFSGDEAPSWGTVHVAILYLIASQLGVSVVGYWRRKLEAQLHVSMVRNLTITLYTRVLRFSADFFHDREVERINTRALEDSERVATLWMEGVLGIPLALVSIVVFAGWMLAANWFLGACMIPLSLLSGYFLFFDRHIQALNAQDRETRDNIRTQASQTIGAAAEFRHHFAFDYGLGPLRQSFNDFQRLMTRMGNLMALFQALTPFIATLQIGVLTWLGAALVLGEFPSLAFAGRLTWGEVVGFMLLLQLFQKPVSDVTGFVLRWRIARESFQRVEEFLERPRVFEPAGNEPTLAPGPVGLTFDRVGVKAPSGAAILNGVELQIAPGTHVAFAGPSGSGKSSAIKLIVREFEPSQGRLALNARAVEDYNGESLARTVGFVPQRPILMNASIRNNILLGLRRSSGRTLQDAEGPIDVSGMESVQGPADLDRELLRVVRLVGLELDVLRKALDNPLPPGRGGLVDGDVPPQEQSPLRARVGELRAAVAERLKGTAEHDFVPFEEDRYLPGPLVDNLVWVGLGRSEPPSAVAARLLDSLSGEDLLEQLLELWRGKLLSDQSLRSRALLRAPRLLALLPACPSALEGGEALARCKCAPVTALPRALRLTLVEAALGADSIAAQKMFAKDHLPQRILAVRRMIAERNAGWPGCWRAIGREEYLPSLTLRENLLGGRVDLQRLGAADRVDRAIQEVLQSRGLLAEALLAGLEFVVGEGGKYISGGQAQKTAIARVLLKNPSLLILDEATAALDELSQAQITEMVRREFAGRTVVAVSHRLSTIRHADRIAVLDHGQVAQEGTYEELASREGIFRELVRQEGEEPRPTGGGAAPAEAVAANGKKGEGGTRLCHQLARCPLFAHLRSDNLEHLERLAKEVRCAPGEVLFHPGDPGTDFYLILEGEVEFFSEHQTGDGVRRDVVRSYGPGGFFGELALFGGGRRSLGAVARAELHLSVLRRDDLLALVAADPQIAVGLLRAMATRLTEAIVHIVEKPQNA